MACLIICTGFLVACGKQPAEPVSIDVEMSEYAYSPSTLEVIVSQEVTINLSNVGVLEHELMLGRQVDVQDGKPNGYQQDMFEVSGVEPVITGSVAGGESTDDHMHENPGVMVVLPSGQAGSIKFLVTREMVGEWEMSCFSQDGVHYTAGMVGKLVVAP